MVQIFMTWGSSHQFVNFQVNWRENGKPPAGGVQKSPSKKSAVKGWQETCRFQPFAFSLSNILQFLKDFWKLAYF